MKGPPLGPGGENITWPDKAAPQSRKALSPQNLKCQNFKTFGPGGAGLGHLTSKKAHDLGSWRYALLGLQKGVPGGAALCLRERCLALSNLPSLTASPLRMQPGNVALVPWTRGVRGRGPVTGPTAHALAIWHCELLEWLRGASGGGHLLPP